MNSLRAEHVSITIGGRTLIRALDWQVSAGQFWCVLGRNGVGKTSLLHTIAGLLRPSTGRVLIDEVALPAIPALALARLRGLMPQQHVDAFSMSVLETLLIGRTPYRIGRGWDTDADIAAARAALDSVDLGGRAGSDVLQLSGGERQRVALATLLVQAPAIMLLDEPTAHQDVAHQLAMLALVRQLSERHAVVMNCHDINLAARFATHVLVLGADRSWSGTVDAVLVPAVLEPAFGCAFRVLEGQGMRSFIAG
ncbi:ABC transporter ATP-binding protein [Actimicrobium sp. CCC2.4]|uniref:ABC transporter ATP-binding protein n=1 Tax=Actimicrobium sp. CCC2.4 TaxID=3048606 RepID=UPI002AC8EFB6|nr:ABC transporter ATP-binding protein [Actimicrobium sp. CCC2.4]MEB0135893.1 ABC transporter ATP-binding protein [Actimicrobium sp. CCC2.4]WPX33368.1 ABC transporter ATP-binding protein [Actimicrobium sp. CCC2.4]